EEYLHSEKYQIRVRDWNAAGNINADVKLLNRIRRETPALQRYDNLTFHTSENEQVLFYRKSGIPKSEIGHRPKPKAAVPLEPRITDPDILVAVNLDPKNVQSTMVHVPLAEMGIAPNQSYVAHDLLTDTRYTWRGSRNFVRLDPSVQVAHVLRVET